MRWAFGSSTHHRLFRRCRAHGLVPSGTCPKGHDPTQTPQGTLPMENPKRSTNSSGSSPSFFEGPKFMETLRMGEMSM